MKAAYQLSIFATIVCGLALMALGLAGGNFNIVVAGAVMASVMAPALLITE